MASQALVALDIDIALHAPLPTGDMAMISIILCLRSCIHPALVPARLGGVLLLRLMLLVAWCHKPRDLAARNPICAACSTNLRMCVPANLRVLYITRAAQDGSTAVVGPLQTRCRSSRACWVVCWC